MSTARQPNPRTQQIRRIKMAQRQLQLDDATYRSLLMRVTGVNSCAAMTPEQRNAVIKEFVRLGFKETRKAEQRKRWPGEPKDCDDVPMLRKVRALLTDAQREWNYAHKMAEKTFHVKRVEWLREDQLHSLIAMLEIDAKRRKK